MAKILDRLQDINGNITFSQNSIVSGSTYIIDNKIDVSTQYMLSIQQQITLDSASDGNSSFSIDIYNSVDGTSFGPEQKYMSLSFTPNSTDTTITFTSQNIDVASLRYIKFGITNNLSVNLSQDIIQDKQLF